MIERIDKLLWTFSSIDFIPHCRADDKLADVTPVILGHHAANLPHDVLLNLDVNIRLLQPFPALDRNRRNHAGRYASARKRYRFYQDRGYEIRHHKLGAV